MLLRTAAGTVACQVGAATACFDVAGPGQPVPGLYDPGIEALFTTNLEQLARRSYGYEVRDGGPFSVADVQGHCFVIVARENAPKPVVDDGTYCLSDSGMPLSVQYSAGKLTLTKVGDPPTEAQLQPPSAPTPLPSA